MILSGTSHMLTSTCSVHGPQTADRDALFAHSGIVRRLRCAWRSLLSRDYMLNAKNKAVIFAGCRVPHADSALCARHAVHLQRCQGTSVFRDTLQNMNPDFASPCAPLWAVAKHCLLILSVSVSSQIMSSVLRCMCLEHASHIGRSLIRRL